MDEKILKQLKSWVNSHYSPITYNWTAERSYGNYDDCFSDGFECGLASAAYSVGNILGMELEEPEETEEDE